MMSGMKFLTLLLVCLLANSLASLAQVPDVSPATDKAPLVGQLYAGLDALASSSGPYLSISGNTEYSERDYDKKFEIVVTAHNMTPPISFSIDGLNDIFVFENGVLRCLYPNCDGWIGKWNYEVLATDAVGVSAKTDLEFFIHIVPFGVFRGDLTRHGDLDVFRRELAFDDDRTMTFVDDLNIRRCIGPYEVRGLVISATLACASLDMQATAESGSIVVTRETGVFEGTRKSGEIRHGIEIFDESGAFKYVDAGSAYESLYDFNTWASNYEVCGVYWSPFFSRTIKVHQDGRISSQVNNVGELPDFAVDYIVSGYLTQESLEQSSAPHYVGQINRTVVADLTIDAQILNAESTADPMVSFLNLLDSAQNMRYGNSSLATKVSTPYKTALTTAILASGEDDGAEDGVNSNYWRTLRFVFNSDQDIPVSLTTEKICDCNERPTKYGTTVPFYYSFDTVWAEGYGPYFDEVLEHCRSF